MSLPGVLISPFNRPHVPVERPAFRGAQGRAPFHVGMGALENLESEGPREKEPQPVRVVNRKEGDRLESDANAPAISAPTFDSRPGASLDAVLDSRLRVAAPVREAAQWVDRVLVGDGALALRFAEGILAGGTVTLVHTRRGISIRVEGVEEADAWESLFERTLAG